MSGICLRYIPHSTPFSKAALKRCELSGGRLFGLTKTKDGLKRSFGLSPVTAENAPVSTTGIYLSDAGNLYLYSGGTVYRSTGAKNNFVKIAEGFASEPNFIQICEKEESYLLITDGIKTVKTVYSSGGSVTSPPVAFGVQHYSRLFGVDAEDDLTLRWSEAGSALSWTESLNGAGYVRLNDKKGGILKLVAYDNKLIAVRRYGLTVVRAYGETEDFRVEVTDTDTDEIYGGTAAVCAGRLMFFTSSGLYCYDGSIKKFSADGLEGFAPDDKAASCGKLYYVCGTLDGDGVIAVIDAESGEVCYIRADVRCVCANGRVFCFAAGAVSEILPEAGGGEWVWEGNFGTLSQKYLESISLDGAAGMLTVKSGSDSRAFTAAKGTLKVGMRGVKFTVEILAPTALVSVCANYVERG